MEHMLEKAWLCELLSESEIKDICEKAIEVFMKENFVVEVPAPVTIAGDTHGQFHDLLELFSVGGDISTTNYLFLGDYVDRGRHGVELVTLLLLLKIQNQERLTLLRGNHEARAQTMVFGFYDECMLKFGSPRVWNMFMSVFDTMPVVAVVDNRLFCAHGGLSPSLLTLDMVKKLEKVGEIPQEGPVTDLVWSDPEDHQGWRFSDRGAGFTFGEDVVEEWSTVNGMEGLVRAHQMFMEGYHWHHGGRTLTVFSAPNYVYRAGNEGAVVKVTEDGMMTKQFQHSQCREEDDSDKIVPRFFI